MKPHVKLRIRPLRGVGLVIALAVAGGCDTRNMLAPRQDSTTVRPRAMMEPIALGTAFAPAPATSMVETPSTEIVGVTTAPDSTWIVVHATGSINLTVNQDCVGCPQTSPTFDFSPTPNVTGPVVVASNSGGPDEFFRMRGSGGAGETPGSAVGLQFVPKGHQVRARINLSSVRGNDPLRGTTSFSWYMGGGYTVEAIAVPSGVMVTESAPDTDGSITYSAHPVMDLEFFNPINLGGPAVPQGAITWNYFVGDTADQTRPSGATYEITECQFQTECRWKPPAPGRMQVHAYVEMQSVYARSEQVQPSQEPKLVLTCDGSTVGVSIVRGDRMECRADAEPAGAALTELVWEFRDVQGHVIAGPTGEPKWGGIMVVGGELKVSGKVNQKPQAATLPVTVRARDWTGKITFPAEPQPEFTKGPPLIYPPTIQGDTLADGTLGKSTWGLPEPQSGYGEGTGPNEGWYFLDAPPYFSPGNSHIFLNDALKPSDPFYRAQRGNAGAVAMGQRACGPEFMAHAARHIPAHESGHYSRAKTLTESPAGAAMLESAVVYGAHPAEDSTAYNAMFRSYRQADQALQDEWDRKSILVVPCQLTVPAN